MPGFVPVGARAYSTSNGNLVFDLGRIASSTRSSPRQLHAPHIHHRAHRPGAPSPRGAAPIKRLPGLRHSVAIDHTLASCVGAQLDSKSASKFLEAVPPISKIPTAACLPIQYPSASEINPETVSNFFACFAITSRDNWLPKSPSKTPVPPRLG